MDDFEAVVRRIIESNRQSREATEKRVSRLLGIMQPGTSEDEYSRTVESIFSEATGLEASDGDLLEEDGADQSFVGGAGI